jgi:hypothetical protein
VRHLVDCSRRRRHLRALRASEPFRIPTEAMASHPRRAADADGVRVVERRGIQRVLWVLATVAGLIALAVVVAVLVIRRGPERSAARPRRIVRGEPAAPDAAVPSPTRSQPEIRHEDIPFPPGERTGIGLFPPPGTKPIRRGIVVPDDFELPEGYVRHYQTTDDGERLEAVLMFHPDFEWVDENGTRIPLPEDRMVPAEMAPPGLKIRMLEVPERAGAADAP